MNYAELRHILDENREARVSFVLPDGSSVPQHFHVTEVGYVRKDFFDCGGVRRIEDEQTFRRRLEKLAQNIVLGRAGQTACRAVLHGVRVFQDR